MKKAIYLVPLIFAASLFSAGCNKLTCWECTYAKWNNEVNKKVVMCDATDEQIKYIEEHTTDINANPIEVDCKRTRKRK